MTLKELQYKVLSMTSLGRGQYRINISYRNKEYYCHSTNSTCYDRISEHKWGADDNEKIDGGLTYKQALQSIYNECKRKNDLV